MQELRLPEYHESNRVTAHLLKGVVYVSDENVWDMLLLHQHRVRDQLAALGLILIVDEHDGFAYVRQMHVDDEVSQGYFEMPKLFRRKRLGYGASVLAVILRDELRKFDESELEATRAVIEGERLFEQWSGMVAAQVDEKKLRRDFERCLAQMTEVGFIKKVQIDGDDYELKRILKARVSLQFLEELKLRISKTASDVDEGFEAEIEEEEELDA